MQNDIVQNKLVLLQCFTDISVILLHIEIKGAVLKGIAFFTSLKIIFKNF